MIILLLRAFLLKQEIIFYHIILLNYINIMLLMSIILNPEKIINFNLVINIIKAGLKFFSHFYMSKNISIGAINI